MNKLVRISLLSAAFLVATPALSATHQHHAAATSKYPLNGYLLAGGGLGYAMGDGSVSWPIAYGTFAYGMRPFSNLPQLAIEPEFRIGFGLAEDKNIKLSSLFSIAGKVKYSITPQLDVNAGLEWMRHSYKVKKVCVTAWGNSYCGGGGNSSDTDLGLLGGVDFNVSKQLSIGGRLEFVDHLTMISGGANFKF